MSLTASHYKIGSSVYEFKHLKVRDIYRLVPAVVGILCMVVSDMHDRKNAKINYAWWISVGWDAIQTVTLPKIFV